MTTAPGAADDLYFTGVALSAWTTHGQGGATSSGPPATFPQANCYVTSSSATQSVVRQYNGVHLMAGYGGAAGYTGTVDFQVSTYVGTLELHSGNIAQNDAFYANAGGGHLADTVHLDWTGGNLNTSSTAGWVHVVGATGIIDPGDGNTVGLGSQFQVNGGADVTQRGGTVQFLTDIGLDIINGTFLCQAGGQPGNFAGLRAKASAEGNVNSDKNRIQINQGGTFSVVNPGNLPQARYDLEKVAVQNLGGNVTIGERVLLTSTATVSNVLSPTETVSVYQSAGQFRLAHGSTLQATNGLKLDGGEFFTTTTETVAANAIPDAVIVGRLIIRSTTITLVENSTTTGVIGNLAVTNGNIQFYSGTFKPVLDCGVNGEPIPANEANPERISKITTAWSLKLGAGLVKIEPRKLNFGAAQMRNGRTWGELFHADQGITSVVAGESLNTPLAGTNFLFDPVYGFGGTTLIGLKLKWQAGN